MSSLRQWLDYELGGMQLVTLAQALGAVIAGFVLAWLARRVVARLKDAATHTSLKFDDVLFSALQKPVAWVFVIGGFWLAARLVLDELQMVQDIETAYEVFRSAFIVLIVWFGIRFSDAACRVWAEKAARTESKVDDQMVPVARAVLKIFIIIVGGTFFLQNLGYSVGSLLAGLGLGGAAVALASKDLIANVFGAVAIFWDRSFEVGDWVQIGDVEGYVEEVGLRTTRIRTFPSSLVTLPNSSLTTGSINNWTRMNKRRAKLTLHLSLSTPSQAVLGCVERLRTILAQDPAVVPEEYVVSFDSIDEYSYCIFIQFYTKSVVWKEHLDAKQAFLLKAMDELETLGVTLASPALIPARQAVK